MLQNEIFNENYTESNNMIKSIDNEILYNNWFL